MTPTLRRLDRLYLADTFLSSTMPVTMTSEQNLVRLGCKEDRAPGKNGRRLAVLCAATVLCGELSLLAAQTNPGELMRTHFKMERG